MAEPVSENPIIVDLSMSYGCLLIGSLLSCAIWGVSTLQAFLYFTRYRYESDSRWKTFLVAFLWLVSTANEVLVIQALWVTLIPRYGSVLGLAETRPTLMHHGWVAQLVTLCVQLFFIRRIYIFSGKKWIVPLVMVVMSVYQLVIIIPYDVYVYGSGATLNTLESKKAIAMVLALRTVTAVDDIAIAGCMIYYVIRQGVSEYQETRRIIYRLLLITLNTGFWTAVVALVELSLVAKFPNGLQFMVVEGPLCSLYVSTLLACLNTRRYVREGSGKWGETPSNSLGKSGSRGEAPFLLGPVGRDNKRTNGTDTSTAVIKISTSESRTIDYNESMDFAAKGSGVR